MTGALETIVIWLLAMMVAFVVFCVLILTVAVLIGGAILIWMGLYYVVKWWWGWLVRPKGGPRDVEEVD